MIDFEFRPNTYFDGTGPSALLAKLSYPESQWGEEISIYAAPLDGEIYYEVVDFYGNDFKVTPKKSRQPLNLQEFIFLIETMENTSQSQEGNVQLTLSGIPQVQSNIYPQLEEYFEEKRGTFGLEG
ncbi:UDP-glucuronosyltransferase [Litoribacter populi]|uniref:UDP-glucuronosyltransferase n=1 Tax=Litoribacter populi TaxID=2598460 RepID=UPI00117F28BF|nr:UDP-glucuronosyltransferase [Litoribacter populi]